MTAFRSRGAIRVRHHARYGFTLVELLVVLGVLAVLVSLLLPAIVTARRQSHAARCLGNQRQLMAALLMYAAENDGRPAFEGWISGANNPSGKIANWLFDPTVTGLPPASPEGVRTGLFWPYLKDLRVYRCPVDDGPWPKRSTQNVTSYIMNGALTNYQNDHLQTYPLSRFHGPDILTWEIPLYATKNVSVNDASNFPPEGVTLRHSRATTVGCADGHAELIMDSQFNDWCQSGPNRLWCSPMRPDGGAGLFHASNPIPMYY